MDIFKKIEKNLGVILFIALGLTLCLPIILSFPSFSTITDLSKGKDVGDTIGGITAPIFGILTSIFLYITFKQQAKINQEQLNNQYYQSIEVLIGETWRFIEDMQWDDKKGVKALLFFSSHYDVKHTLFDEFYAVLLRFRSLYSLIQNIKSVPERRIFEERVHTLYYTKILWNSYNGYFREIQETKHDDSKYSMKLFAELSISNLNFLLANQIIIDSAWKQDVLKRLKHFLL